MPGTHRVSVGTVQVVIAAAAVALCAACAPTRASLGDLTLRPYQSALSSNVTFGVQEGRLVGNSVDVAIDPDGCARGEVSPGTMVVLCPKPIAGQPQQEGGKLILWTGLGGNFATEVSADGKQLRVDGSLGGPRLSRQVHTTLLFGSGPQWDELRTHPVLLAVAAAVTGVQGVPSDYEKKAVEDLSK